MKLNDDITFVSYDGRWPHLCSGTLVFKIGEEEYSWPNALKPSDNSNVRRTVPWEVKFPKDFPKLIRPAVTEMVNKHAKLPHCGGCL